MQHLLSNLPFSEKLFLGTIYIIESLCCFYYAAVLASQGIWLIPITIAITYTIAIAATIIAYISTSRLNKLLPEQFEKISEYIFSEYAKVKSYFEKRIKLPHQVQSGDYLKQMINSYIFLIERNGYSVYNMHYVRFLGINSYHSPDREIPKQLFSDVIKMIDKVIENFEKKPNRIVSPEMLELIQEYNIHTRLVVGKFKLRRDEKKAGTVEQQREGSYQFRQGIFNGGNQSLNQDHSSASSSHAPTPISANASRLTQRT